MIQNNYAIFAMMQITHILNFGSIFQQNLFAGNPIISSISLINVFKDLNSKF